MSLYLDSQSTARSIYTSCQPSSDDMQIDAPDSSAPVHAAATTATVGLLPTPGLLFSSANGSSSVQLPHQQRSATLQQQQQQQQPQQQQPSKSKQYARIYPDAPVPDGYKNRFAQILGRDATDPSLLYMIAFDSNQQNPARFALTTGQFALVDSATIPLVVYQSLSRAAANMTTTTNQ